MYSFREINIYVIKYLSSWFMVLSMSDELRRALYSSGASVDMEFSPPDLIGPSEIFTMEHREKLCSVLPARAQGYMWQLAFSTSQHGFSLASMYRKMQRVDSPVLLVIQDTDNNSLELCSELPARAQGYMWQLAFSTSQHGFSLASMYRKMQRVDSPVLLVIQDTDNNVFGALTSCALHPSEHFYGTGESLLFAFQRVEDRRHSPTQAEDTDEHQQNKEDKEVCTLSVLSGKFGIWLDGDLYLGRTQRCTTYGNEPLSTREDFVVKIMECWTFI
ncbi:Oxygen resistance protein 1 [Operophtera brumata]|uniref:Oxidation resistance protein 1 n=1 Tax=Operophtera brumata TaxID=104452 RepID=A0A0L7KVS4_OPEBR|nr:Oxygen resistance protein 1 [Operophtera brumata]